MGVAIALTWFLGWFVSAGVGRARVDIGQLGRLSASTVSGSLPWFLSQMGIMVVWPVVLVIWLARGRPPCPWKAVNGPDGSPRVRRRSATEMSAAARENV